MKRSVFFGHLPLLLAALPLLAGPVPRARAQSASEPVPEPAPTVRAGGPMLSPMTAPRDTSLMPETLDLKAAVQIAIRHNPSILEASKKVDEEDILRSKAWSALFPSVSVVGTSYNKKDSVFLGSELFDGNSYNMYEIDFHATQTLYQYGLLSSIDLVSKQRELNQLALDIDVRNLVQQVIDGFYTLLSDQSALQHLLEVEKTEQASLAITTKFYHIGRAQLLDVLQAKTQLALLQPQIDTTRNQVRVDAVTLANILGDRNAREIHIKGDLDTVSLPEMRSKIHLSEAHLPEYETAVVNLEALEDQKSVALGPDLPSLGLIGDWGRNAFTKTDVLDPGSTFWALGLQLTIPVFSGLSSVFTRHDYANQNEQLNLELNNVSNNLALAQVKSQRNLDVAYAGIGSSNLAFKLASDSLNEAKRQYRLGTINFLQFLTVEQTYYQSQVTLDQAKYTYISDLAAYYVATGLPIEQLVAELQGGNHG